MPAAGETIIAGKVPGERIATSIVTEDSDPVTTTETVVQTVVAPVVVGRTYRVRAAGHLDSTVAGDIVQVRIREDNLTGTVIMSYTEDMTVANVNIRNATTETEYTADATEDKTFVVTIVRLAGSGNMIWAAGLERPNYLYVDYIRG